MALYWVGIITGRKNHFNRTAPHRSIYIYRRTTIPRGNDDHIGVNAWARYRPATRHRNQERYPSLRGTPDVDECESRFAAIIGPNGIERVGNCFGWAPGEILDEVLIG